MDGRFIAAVLDDIVMEPLTGRLMSVLYRFSTPGTAAGVLRALYQTACATDT